MSTPSMKRRLTIGRYIKAQREIARLSVRHLARMAEVSDSYLSQIEKGRYQPSAQVLTNLAKGLNLQPDVLFRMARLAADDSG